MTSLHSHSHRSSKSAPGADALCPHSARASPKHARSASHGRSRTFPIRFLRDARGSKGGRFDGRTLRSLIESDPASILGRAASGPDGGFPLLVKLLDAARTCPSSCIRAPSTQRPTPAPS